MFPELNEVTVEFLERYAKTMDEGGKTTGFLQEAVNEVKRLAFELIDVETQNLLLREQVDELFEEIKVLQFELDVAREEAYYEAAERLGLGFGYAD